MPYRLQQIDPNDLNNRRYIGVGIPFNQPGVFRQTFTSKEAIKSNIINFLLTEQGDRYFNNLFGSGLRNFLFEQLTIETDVDIRTYLITQISAVFNNITIEEVDINFNEDRNQINISFDFTYDASGETDTIELTL